MNSEGPDQTAQICGLVWVSAIRIGPETTCFQMARISYLYDVCQKPFSND